MLSGLASHKAHRAAALAVVCLLLPGVPSTSAAQTPDSTCVVHLQGADFTGPAADIARLLHLQDSASPGSFVMLRAGASRAADVCGAPAAVQRIARHLGMSAPVNGIRLLPAEALVTGNSAYPRDWNDGALWSGRGLNAAVSAGAAFRSGPFRAALAPVITWQSNADFDTPAGTDTARSPFATTFWGDIDLPQRFGAGSFTRVDPGQSYARVDVRGFGAGISTESIRWGPARRNPILLSGTSAGFAHAFVESARPIDIWIGDLEFQLFWGGLEESQYFDNEPDNDRRLLAGILLALRPRILEGLTIGAGRLQALTWWPELSTSDLIIGPYRGLQANPQGRSGDNQLLGVFFRWESAPGGLEAYGEWARDDHWEEWTGLLRNLDMSQAWSLGMQKVIRQGDNALRLAAEVAHLSDAPPRIGRGYVAFYTNGSVQQGHTHRGQLLGAPIGTGAESLYVGADYFWSRGRTGLSLERNRYEDDFYNLNYAERYGAQARDTELSIRGGHLMLLRGGLALDAEAGWSVRYNRAFLGLNTLAPGDAYRRDVNWSLRLGARWTPGQTQ